MAGSGIISSSWISLALQLRSNETVEVMKRGLRRKILLRRKICYIDMSSASQFLNACSSFVSHTMQISHYTRVSSASCRDPKACAARRSTLCTGKFLGRPKGCTLQLTFHRLLADTTNRTVCKYAAVLEAECLVCLCTVRWASERLQASLALVASVHGNRASHCPVLRR